MTDIAGMFGISPDQIRIQRMQQMMQQNAQVAQMNPFQQADYAMRNAGGMLVQGGAQMAGLKTREEQIAEGRQQIGQMVADGSAKSYLEAAKKANEMGDPQAAQALYQKSQELEQAVVDQEYKIAQTTKALAEAKDLPKMRHEEQLAKIEQAAKDAKQRSEDKRLDIEQRREAAKEKNDLLKYLAEIKIGTSASSSITGQNTVGNLTTGLRDYYNQLDEAGAITNPDKNVMQNIAAWASSTSAGQLASGMAGTNVQAARDAISQQRPLLLQAIKQATGMTAKQMDSNTELQMYLKVATDPKLSVRANREALDKIDQLYGVGGIGIAKPADPSSSTRVTIPSGMIDMNAVQAEIERRKKK